jgi:cytoskeleton protein RodZ
MSDVLRGEFGPLLRNAREKRGVSLQQVAATTKISARVLDALERNDPSLLPGGIFSRSFVRAYAREVGLDPEETVSQFVAAFPPEIDHEPPTTPSRTVDAEDFESSRRTAVTVLQVAGLSIVVVIAWLIYMALRPAPNVPTPPARDAMSTPAQPPPTAPMPVTTAAGTPASDPPAPPAVAPSTATLSATPATSSGAEAALAPTTEAPLAVSILATEACWLSLTVDGSKVVARVLQPGERVAYQARTAVTLSAGNAGALALTINGKPGKRIGGSGQVVTRTITVASAKDFLQ